MHLKFEINKKRDTELLKLRKLLEDVHLESEETAHHLRKKHQEIVVDFQDQIDQLSKARARLVWTNKTSNNFVVFVPTASVLNQVSRRKQRLKFHEKTDDNAYGTGRIPT